MKVESAGSCVIEAGTVTVVFIPMRSTATMAVKILVRLAGARAARALDCQRRRPVSRLTSVTSWAAMTGTGSGRNVAAGRGILVGSGVTVRTADGTGVGVETGTRSGRGPSVISGMAAVSPVGGSLALAWWGGAAEPSALLSAPIATSTAVRRRMARRIAGQSAYPRLRW